MFIELQAKVIKFGCQSRVLLYCYGVGAQCHSGVEAAYGVEVGRGRRGLRRGGDCKFIINDL